MRRTLSGEGLAKPIRFAHFVLRTRRYREVVDWYRRALGMEVVFQNEVLAFLTYDEEHHRLAVVNLPDAAESPPGSVGLDHVAYTYASLGDLLGSYKRLKALGIEPVWSVNHGPTTSLYYQDPDGNRVEFQVDNFETEEALKGWMQSAAFAKNPIGVAFNPDKLCERYENGDPIEALVQQGAA